MIMFFVIVLVMIILSVVILWLLKTKRMTMPFLYIHNQGYTIGIVETSNPLDINVNEINVLSKKQFYLHPEPTIMADPFIVNYENKFYIFYEELSGKFRHCSGADICVLKSENGHNWERLGVALHEPFHLSFPNVFQYNEQWYMIPEAGESKQLRLYKAIDFPMSWKLEKVLFDGVSYADPMIYIDNIHQAIYLWFNDLTAKTLELYYSDALEGEWKKHPCSPIRHGNSEVRPAGTINKIDDTLLYFVQANQGSYGTGTICYKIDVLTHDQYLDHRDEHNPILWKHGDSWAMHGMHHLSISKCGDNKYLCATDGLHASQAWKWDWRNLPQLNIHKN